MKGTVYFVISNSDGDTYVTEETEASLLEQLNPDEHGDVELVAGNALKTIPNMDTGYWRGKFLIIKGEIVTPKTVEVVTRFEI